MARLIVRRLQYGALTMLAAALALFLLFEADVRSIAVAVLGPYSTDEQRNLWLAANGYLDPAYLRFLRWLGHFLLGDWGTSHVFNEPIATLIGERLANTALLGAMFFA